MSLGTQLGAWHVLRFWQAHLPGPTWHMWRMSRHSDSHGVRRGDTDSWQLQTADVQRLMCGKSSMVFTSGRGARWSFWSVAASMVLLVKVATLLWTFMIYNLYDPYDPHSLYMQGGTGRRLRLVRRGSFLLHSERVRLQCGKANNKRSPMTYQKWAAKNNSPNGWIFLQYSIYFHND